MDTKIISFFSITLLLFCSSNAAAFNITTILDQYPSFSNFNSLLSQSRVAEMINSYNPPLTILVVENTNVSPVFDKSPEVLKKIMSVHVILDYLDVDRIKHLQSKSTRAATLFQTTGEAVGNQGYLNITDLSGDVVAFGSLADGSSLGSNLVEPVVLQPYVYSVLQISNVIVPPGIDNSSNSASPVSPPPVSPVSVVSPTTPPVPSPSPSPIMPPSTTPIMTPASTPTTAPTSSLIMAPVVTPTMSPASTLTPTMSPVSTPSKAPTPSPRKLMSPGPTPSKAPAPKPETTAPSAEAPDVDDSSAGTSLGVSAVGVMAAIVTSSLFLVLRNVA